jgi:hypothetical protein
VVLIKLSGDEYVNPDNIAWILFGRQGPVEHCRIVMNSTGQDIMAYTPEAVKAMRAYVSNNDGSGIS